MRTFTLLFIGLIAGTFLRAQSPAVGPDRSPLHPENESIPVAARQAPGAGVLLPAYAGGGCTGVDSLSVSSNIYSLILTEANPIAADNDLNTILFIHRHDAATFGGHSGHLRYEISTNGGATWTRNLGPVNPASVNGTNAARYPSAAIYNPPANTNPANAYLVYQAPTVAATWNGYVSGVRRLNGAGNTENYNQPNLTNTLISRSLCKGAPGKFWSIDAVFNGTLITGFRVLEGTWNGTSDVVWTLNTTLTPSFNLGYDGNPYSSDFNIAFDPTGTRGWICILAHINGGAANYSFYPVFYHTTDGGTTWTGPEQVDIGQLQCVSTNIQASNVATTAFDMDLAVDVNGNPHCVVTVGNGSNAYGIFYTQWHAVMDITLENGVWNAVHLRDVYRGRGNWGTTPNTVSMDMDCQISRTADGTKLFYVWGDADSALTTAAANQAPNLYGIAYDVVTRRWTQWQEFTACTPYAGQILFPRLANNVLGTTGNYQLPVAFASLHSTGEPVNPSVFRFLDSLYFSDTDFLIPQCTTPVSLSTMDTITVCGSTVLNAGSGGQLYRWSTGAMTPSITVTTTGTYWVGVNSGCCTGGDTVHVIVDVLPTAAFSSSSVSLTASFTDQSSPDVIAWSWDFGDGNTSTLQNPSHSYAMPGTYTVCLVATDNCGADTTCQTVSVNCAPATAAWNFTTYGLTATFMDNTSSSAVTWSWAFGDGSFSSQQNPVHTYAMAGTFTACLAVTDTCGSDTVCQLVTVCDLPVAAFSYTANLGMVSFTDNTSPSPGAWSWDFGDGNTSNLQNPQHTYLASGVYTVCLVAANGCGPDTTCQTVNVVVQGLDEGWNARVTTFPNPVSGRLGIRVEGLPAGLVTLRLRNVLGQELWGENIAHSGNELERQVDMARMAGGMYFVELESEGRRWVKKVMRD